MPHKSALIVTHHVYLTREQRYALSRPGQTVEVMGVSSPVWVKDGEWQVEPQEVFCTYKISFTNETEQNTVRVQRDGYLITLTGTMPGHLLDVSDGGSSCLMLTHRNFIKKGAGKPVTVIHCVSVEDLRQLRETMV